MSIQSEDGERFAFKKETSFGEAPGPTGAKLVRQIDNNLALTKSLMESKEKRPDFQKTLGRHGNREVKGPINGQFSPGTYAELIASLMRRSLTAGTALSALNNVTASASAPHFVRAAGSWLAAGLRVGDVIDHSGWTGAAAANTARNYTIVALTATDMTVAEPVVAAAAGDSVVMAVRGKKTFVPTTGHTSDSYAFERWFADAGLSKLFLGQKPGSIDIKFTPGDIAGITIGLVGQDMVRGSAAYFTNPGAETTTPLLAGVSAHVFVQGGPVALITDLNLKLDAGLGTGKVLGSKVTPGVFQGTVAVSGSMTVYLDSPTFYAYFDDETIISLIVRLDATDDKHSDFVSFAIGSATVVGGSISKDNKAMTISFDFTAGKNDGSDGWEATTIQMQDTLA